MLFSIEALVFEKKFVIWGVGARAEIITQQIGEKNIIAYIDSDETKWGEQFFGNPIVSVDEYMQNYSDCFIIVTPVDEDDILNQLKGKNITSFFRMSQIPSEMQGYGKKSFWQDIDIEISDDGKYIVYGTNLYAYIIYLNIKQLGYQVKLYASKENRIVAKELEEKLLCDILSSEEEFEFATIILCTREVDKKQLEERYPKINSIDEIYDLSDRIKDYYNSSLVSFKNKHEGQRCFIVATGPSLKEEDLKMLSKEQEICFGLNRIYNISTDVWKPDYYVFVDRMGLIQYWESVATYDVDNKFIGDSYVGEKEVSGNVYKIHALTGDSYNVLPQFSEEIEKKVYIYSTVTYVAIQIAAYMGFKEIYLVGVDCNYITNGKNNYFFKEDRGDKINHYENRMISAYIAANEYAKSKGIKIYNATRGGKLEVYDRVNFDSIFSKEND